MERLINLTPHPVTVVDGQGTTLKVIYPSGRVVRLSQHTESVGTIDGVPISKTVYGSPEGLPEFEAGVYYVVSQLVKGALPNRRDLLVPAEIVRDSNNNIVGCKSLGL